MANLVKKIYDYSLEDIMGDSFKRYSKYIIQDRAIPDVRDGLKPVQRRILFAMYKNKNTYNNSLKKCALAVGDVMGKYHPHGDSSIYDAMVRMSQDFKYNHTLIYIKGNNGSRDGDSAAASRYTETRLEKIADELLKDLDKDTVLFAPNYSDDLLEPTVLPAKYPNLLVNGTTGISAGYATNIPPHNLVEVIDATLHLIDNPDTTVDEIMKYIKGPDFPTGGTCINLSGIKEAFTTGRGKVVLRSNYEIVSTSKMKQIIINEIPYDVNKAMLVRKIDEIIADKKVDGMLEIRDESDRNGLKIIIDLKKDANDEHIINYLLKSTDMQISFNYNMVAIDNRRPKLLGVLPILKSYIEHAKEVLTRKSQFELEHAKHRYHILEGLIKVLDILDEVIKVIRASKNKSDAIKNLIAEFKFSEIQATAIVELQLYRLTNTDIEDLMDEMSKLDLFIKALLDILNNEKTLLKKIKHDLTRISKEYGRDRLTTLSDESAEIIIDMQAMIPKEDVVVAITKTGYIKRVSKRSYSAGTGAILKDDDYLLNLYSANTHDTVLLFTNLGNYLYLKVHEIPEFKYKDLGKHVSNIITMKEDEYIINTMCVTDFNADILITMFSKYGMVKRTKLVEFEITRNSKPITCMKLKDNDEVISIDYGNNPHVFVSTYNGYSLIYEIDEVAETSKSSSGIKSIALKDNDYVVSSILFNEEQYVTIFTSNNTAKRIKLSELEISKRARRGLLILKEIKSNSIRVEKAFIVDKNTEMVIKTENDEIILKNTDIKIMDRYSGGSSITKERILDIYINITDLNEAETISVDEENINSVPVIDIDEIDNKILTIDDFLEDLD